MTYFRLQGVRCAEPSISTAAIWPCALCDGQISSMGGPGRGELCKVCGDDLLAGRLRGTIRRTLPIQARPPLSGAAPGRTTQRAWAARHAPAIPVAGMAPPGPVRLRLSRRRGFDLQELSRATNGRECVLVTRPGFWGNPFKVAGSGAQETVVEQFRRWLADSPEGRWVATRARKELRGKNVACWCALDAPCHGDVLLEAANTWPE